MGGWIPWGKGTINIRGGGVPHACRLFLHELLQVLTEDWENPRKVCRMGMEASEARNSEWIRLLFLPYETKSLICGDKSKKSSPVEYWWNFFTVQGEKFFKKVLSLRVEIYFGFRMTPGLSSIGEYTCILRVCQPYLGCLMGIARMLSNDLDMHRSEMAPQSTQTTKQSTTDWVSYEQLALISHDSQVWKSEIRMPPWSCSGEDPLSGADCPTSSCVPKWRRESSLGSLL